MHGRVWFCQSCPVVSTTSTLPWSLRGLLGTTLLQHPAHPHGHHLRIPVVVLHDEGVALAKGEAQS